MRRRFKWPTLAAVAAAAPVAVDVLILGLEPPRAVEVLARGSVLLVALAYKPSGLFSKQPPSIRSPD